MIPNRIWSAVEDPIFSASLGVVSTPRAFDTALLRQPPVLELFSSLAGPEDASAVAARIQQLLKDPSNDERYCHPYDLPIAVYLRALDIICEPPVAAEAADSILRFSNLWWARATALRMAANPTKRIPVLRQHYQLGVSPAGVVREVHASSPLYAVSTRMAWQPAVTAKLRITTDSPSPSVDLSPAPATIRAFVVGTPQ